MKINFKTDRYCNKCHKIKDQSEFKKIPKIFRISGQCKKHVR